MSQWTSGKPKISLSTTMKPAATGAAAPSTNTPSTSTSTSTSASTFAPSSSSSSSSSSSGTASTGSAPTRTPMAYSRAAAAHTTLSTTTSTAPSATSTSNTTATGTSTAHKHTSSSGSGSSSTSSTSPSSTDSASSGSGSGSAPVNGDTTHWSASLSSQLVAGAHVSISTPSFPSSPSVTHSGIVYCYDPTSQICVLEIMVDGGQAQTPHKDFVLLPTHEIKVTVHSPAGSFPVAKRVWEPIDAPALKAKEEKAILERQAEAEKIGIGVTPLAQHLFDALSKMYPCRWEHGAGVITVMDTIRITPPYGAENVIGSDPHQTQRVRTIVEVERSRLSLKQNAPQ